MKEVNPYINFEKTDKIRLNANESYINIDKELTFSIASIISKVEFNRYPETTNKELIRAYSKYVGVDESNILAGNGSDEMIGLLINSYISKGKKVLTLDPDFTMYDFYSSINEGDIVKFKITGDKVWDVNKFIEFGLENNPDMIVFSNPNNPTGLSISLEEIEKIVEAFKDKIVVIDEAYYEFYGVTAVPLINNYKNLYITRTLSKAWGLASLRVGFLIGNIESIKKVTKYKVPYTINTLSQKISRDVLKNKEKLKENVEKIVSGREDLYKALKDIEKEAALTIKIYPSKANFIYGETPYRNALEKALENRGIIIRYIKEDGFRITVGTPAEDKKLLQVIREVFVY